MDPEVKKILNRLRCPLCGGQIDTKYPIFECVFNHLHCQVSFIFTPDGDFTPEIDQEAIIVFDDGHKYYLYQTYGCRPRTVIHFWKVDPEHNIDEGCPQEALVLDYLLFDFADTNEQKILNRIKMVLVFQ